MTKTAPLSCTMARMQATVAVRYVLNVRALNPGKERMDILQSVELTMICTIDNTCPPSSLMPVGRVWEVLDGPASEAIAAHSK